MKVYISGNTIGLPQRFRFEDAEAYLTKNNHSPVNPFNCSTLSSRIELLSNCDAIFLLTDWLSCNDSRIEKYYADITGKLIMFESRIEEENKQTYKEEIIISRIKGAIQEVTGLAFEQYAKDERIPGKRLHKCRPVGYFCRMIFSIQCEKAGIKAKRITRYIPRHYTSILHYLSGYKSEYDFNKEFRTMADSVNEKLYPSIVIKKSEVLYDKK